MLWMVCCCQLQHGCRGISCVDILPDGPVFRARQPHRCSWCQVVYKFQKRDELEALLREHVCNNLVKVRRRLYRQSTGIAQVLRHPSAYARKNARPHGRTPTCLVWHICMHVHVYHVEAWQRVTGFCSINIAVLAALCRHGGRRALVPPILQHTEQFRQILCQSPGRIIPGPIPWPNNPWPNPLAQSLAQ